MPTAGAGTTGAGGAAAAPTMDGIAGGMPTAGGGGATDIPTAGAEDTDIPTTGEFMETTSSGGGVDTLIEGAGAASAGGTDTPTADTAEATFVAAASCGGCGCCGEGAPIIGVSDAPAAASTADTPIAAGGIDTPTAGAITSGPDTGCGCAAPTTEGRVGAIGVGWGKGADGPAAAGGGKDASPTLGPAGVDRAPSLECSGQKMEMGTG